MNSLPADVTSFVGRRQATTEVKRALSASRLVTLTGVGGVGKTRLALHGAGEMRRAFADGVCLVKLAEVDYPPLVPNALAMALGLHDVSTRATAAVLADYLADKRLLLVLDNCEHLLDACGHLVGELLPAAPGLRVLATSREPLGIAGEQVWPVPPLSVPDAEAPLAVDGGGHWYEALTLFEDRAAAALPGFTINPDNEQAVARLCQRLDGLPLAIELAAVQIRALSAEQILARVNDSYHLLTRRNRATAPRHQTLRAAIEWSFDLCTELERTLWARLSVFPGEFDIEAAEGVCAGEGLAAQDVFSGVAGLVDKSILTPQVARPHVRYRMLDTIRQHGRERLTESGDELTLRRRHRDYYLCQCEQAEAEWFGSNQVALGNCFRAEQANWWAALEFSLTQAGQAHSGLRMAATMGMFSVYIGPIRNGRRCVEHALAVDTAPSRERARALWVASWIALYLGDLARASCLLDKCAELARRLGDETALDYATQFIGRLRALQNQLPEARALLEQAVEHHRAAGRLNSTTFAAWTYLSMVTDYLGDTERAISICEELVAVSDAHGERRSRSWALWYLGTALWRKGDLQWASKHVKEALQLQRTLNDQLSIPFCVDLLGLVAGADGEPERAATLFGISERMWESIGTPLFGAANLLDERQKCRARAQQALGQRAFDAASQRGRQLTSDAAVAYALGEITAPPVAAAAPAAAASEPVLTKREREVAALVARGMTNKDIAAELVISQRTAEAHIEHILNKLGFTSRTQIAAWAVQ
jgi:non-specific serine/threonine protein kinase